MSEIGHDGQAREWRETAGFSDYEVSNDGRVRRRRAGGSYPKGWPLTPQKLNGYWVFSLRDDSRVKRSALAHRLVARAFLGEPPSPLHTVAHWDGNPDNNRVENLRWATVTENHADKVRHGTMVTGEAHPNSKLTTEKAREIRANYIRGVCGYRQLGERYGVSAAAVKAIIVGKTWKVAA